MDGTLGSWRLIRIQSKFSGWQGGKNKWKKKNVKKIQPVRHVIKPILAASRRKRPTPRRN
jgi:hypothetical protein